MDLVWDLDVIGLLISGLSPFLDLWFKSVGSLREKYQPSCLSLALTHPCQSNSFIVSRFITDICTYYIVR